MEDARLMSGSLEGEADLTKGKVFPGGVGIKEGPAHDSFIGVVRERSQGGKQGGSVTILRIVVKVERFFADNVDEASSFPNLPNDSIDSSIWPAKFDLQDSHPGSIPKR